MKLRSLKVATLVGVVVGVALVAAPQASAATPTTPASPGSTMALPTLPAKPTIKPDIVPTAASDNCAAVVPHLKEYAARGIKEVACESGTRTVATPVTHAAKASVTPNAFPAACGNNTWVVTRTEECNLSSVHNWTTYDGDTGVPNGSETYLISQDIRLSTRSSTITESVTFNYASAVGAPAGLPANVDWTSACAFPCEVSSVPTIAFTLPVSLSKTFTVTFQDNPAPQGLDTFGTSYSYVALPTGFVLIGGPDTWGSPALIRCDSNTPGFTNPGCVVPSYVPTLTLPLSSYGAAAMNAYVGELYLPGTPGLTTTTPLTRGDPADTNSNRSIICSGFQPLPPGNSYGVVSDSCDEYPFASSQQSGGAIGVGGNNCLQIVPKQGNNGAWIWIALNTYTRAYPQICVRGHVNNVLNTSVGNSALNPMYTLNRMMIGDAYTVQVTQ